MWGRMAEGKAPSTGATWGLQLTRWGVPAALVVAGVVLVLVGGSTASGIGIVLIGAGQGIGRQAAHALASVGARVFCVDLDPDLADDVAKEVGGIPWSGNAIERPDAERLFSDAGQSLGQIDGVIDIVGMARYASLVDIDDDNWNWHHDIVLRHAYLAMQLGGRAMTATGGGVMVFVASVSGITSAPLHAAYGAAVTTIYVRVRPTACRS